MSTTSYKELENLAALARQGSTRALELLRDEVSKSMFRIVRQVMRTGGQNLPAHRQVHAVLTALQKEKYSDRRMPELELTEAAASYLCDRSLTRFIAAEALETVRD
jgi:hypothetical protein